MNETGNMILSAKKRNAKIYITDVSIEKIPKIEYKGLNDNENEALYKLAKFLLLTSQKENDSNEVAVTCSLDSEDITGEIGISFGDEHEVDICADTKSNHLIISAKRCAVIVLHNHPSTQTLSMEDIRFLMHFEAIRLMVVVTNQGTIHYVCKEDTYDHTEAVKLYKECADSLKKGSRPEEFYEAGRTFLKRCSEVGMYYQ